MLLFSIARSSSSNVIVVVLSDTDLLRRCIASLSFGTITAQVCHPPDVLVDIIPAHHVHYFTCIPLRMLILKLALEAFVGLAEERVSLRVLFFG